MICHPYFFSRYHKYERKISVKKYYTKIFYLICSADSHSRGKKGIQGCENTYVPGTTPTCVGKVKFFILHIYFARILPFAWEKASSHACLHPAVGSLPLAWEKDLVFMDKISVSSSFCHWIFYNKSHKFLHYFIWNILSAFFTFRASNDGTLKFSNQTL